MGVFGDEQQLCPCYKDCQEFNKLVELKDSGLAIYCHRARAEDNRQGVDIESAINTSKDVFIIHNKKDMKITTSELFSELEKENISCPRCRRTFEHAQELMLGVKSIDTNIVMGLCDHCRKKSEGNKKPFCSCDEIVKKFIFVKGEQKEDTKKYAKILLSKIGIKDDAALKKPKQIKSAVYSELLINRGVISPASRHEPEIQQMFHPERPKLNVKVDVPSDLKQGVAFAQPIEPVETSISPIPQQIPDVPLLRDSDTTFVETYSSAKESPKPSLKYRKDEDLFEDRPSMDAKQELKRRHDLSLRQIMRPEKDSGVPQTVSKRPDIYETPKIVPWEQKEPSSKYHVVSEVDIIKKSYVAPGKTKKYHHEKIKKESYHSERQKKVKELEDHYVMDEKLKLRRHKTKKLDQHVSKLKSASAGIVVKPQFSFIFPKVKEKEEKQIKLVASSSHLIKDTQEKYRQRAEREKKAQELERQQKLEQEQKKKLAREEKRLQAEEKRKAAEDQKKYEEDQKRLIEDKKHSGPEHKIDELTDKEKKEQKEKNKTDDRISKAMKSQKGKRETTDKEYETTDKGKKVDNTHEQKSKYDETTDKKKDVKTEYEQKDEVVGKEQKIKMDKEDRDEISQRLKEEKERLKLLESLRKEKKQAVTETEELSKEKESPSKTKKAAKKTRNSSNELVVSTSKIKSIKKEASGDIKDKQEKEKETKHRTSKEESTKPHEELDSELQKLRAEHLKEKEEALRNKQRLEKEAKTAKAKEETKEQSKLLQVDMKKIKVKKMESDEFLRLVKIKQAAKLRASDIHPQTLHTHKCHHTIGQKSIHCPLCLNSDLELEVMSVDNKKNRMTDITDIIIGEKIVPFKPRFGKTKVLEGVPILFQTNYVESDQQQKEIVQTHQETIPEEGAKKIAMEPGKGVICYALSDRSFIDKGWTMLPTEKVVRKMNVYRMRPAHPEFDWFEHNKKKGPITYDTGEKLAEFDENGRGRWYYRSGRRALDYYNCEEKNAQQRFVIYSSGEPDERGRSHPITILATFDYLGNGVVFDHAGKIRLKYNQTEGVVLDRGIGPVSHWQWHSLNDPPVLQQVMIDTQMTYKDPKILKLGSSSDKTTRTDNAEMLAIEFDNFIREKSKKLSQKFKPFQIKMKALKINEHFSLRVLDQATVYLIFRDGSTNLKLNIGMILDHQEIVDTDTAEVGEVSNSIERFPARTDSLAGLQRSVAHAQRYERQHTERERRLRPQVPCASVDRLTAAVSPPMRPPLITHSGSSASTGCCGRKPANDLYYDNRLL